MATDISIAATGRALDAAAVALDAQATAAPPAGGVENIAARQQIRDAFINVAGGANDIGNGPHERQVDRMLFDMLPKIDFSAPGGQAYAKEIGDFISTAGDRFTGAEVEHLRGLLDEAAAALPAGGTATTGPTPPENPQSELLDLLSSMIDSLRDGKVDGGERRDLLSQIADVLQQLAGGGAPTTPPGEPIFTIQPVPNQGPPVSLPDRQPAPPAPATTATPDAAGNGQVSNGPQERPQEPTSQIPATPDRAQAQSVRPGDADPALAAQRSAAGSPDSQTELAPAAKPEEASGAATTAPAATTATTTAAPAERTDAAAPAQNDKVLAGVLSLLGDVLSAQKDGQLDNTERQQLLSDLTKLVQALVGEAPPSTGGPDPKPTTGPGSGTTGASGTSGASGTATTQEPRIHDAVWFLEKSGLANFLSGFFSNNNSQLTNMVMQTLRSTEPKANA
jgi:hypothetical protein